MKRHNVICYHSLNKALTNLISFRLFPAIIATAEWICYISYFQLTLSSSFFFISFFLSSRLSIPEKFGAFSTDKHYVITFAPKEDETAERWARSYLRSEVEHYDQYPRLIPPHEIDLTFYHSLSAFLFVNIFFFVVVIKIQYFDNDRLKP